MASGELAAEVARLTGILLDPEREAWTLRPEVTALAERLVEASGHTAAERIDAGESRTSVGLALSPTMAAMCIEDYVRTIVFLRGVHAAVEARSGVDPVRVLYVGCGPLATLVGPLLTVIDPARWRCRWIDVHEESVACARRVAATLDPGGVVQEIVHGDAFDLRIDPSAAPDVIVLEILQAVLEKEPQVALTRHLVGQAPGATLVPERIEIALEWLDVAPGLEGSEESAVADCGTVFAVDRDTASIEEVDGRLLGTTVTLPDPLPSHGTPMLCTRLRVFGEHRLHGMQSGLTVPRMFTHPGALRAGQRIACRYRLGESPGLETIDADD